MSFSRRLKRALAPQKEPGYENHHSLIEVKEPGYWLTQLRERLLQEQHRDILTESQKAKDFAEALGTIAAMCDIILDGDYTVSDLCRLLCKALDGRKVHKDQMHLVDPGLVMAEIKETADALIIEAGERVAAPEGKITGKEREVAAHMLFMAEHGCSMCDDRTACQLENRCLAKDGGGILKKELH